MTRMLSEIFGAEEHLLRQGLQRLERASGYNSADVRLTADMLQAAQRKLTELGLDAHDTTGPELYGVLRERLLADDRQLVEALSRMAGSDQVVDAIAYALKVADIERSTFALKQTTAKSLLKKQVPKQTMRHLGYRSVDSMLKHESVAALLAAAWLLESVTWRRLFYDGYKRLKSSDFEAREVAVITPNNERWQKLADILTNARKHTVVALKEYGAIVLLPQPTTVPPAVMTTTLMLALHSMNELRAASTLLKLCQVKANFGAIVQDVVADEQKLSTDLLDQQVPWQIIQRYYARFQDAFRAEVLEPHIQASDLSWHSIEDVLASIEPSMGFWRGTDHLAIVRNGQPVSFNVIDVALATCNQLPYEHRIVHYLQHSLWNELLLKYLKHDSVEQVVLGQLESELATEPALI
ncbi:hypothetical protein H7097_00965 [Aeromicrobium sp.]|nr:hypothetical protein [Candidatus Saccharibacteria bacterium]